jgi:hypothetical protein
MREEAWKKDSNSLLQGSNPGTGRAVISLFKEAVLHLRF